jgi:hypothetical protein
MRRPLVVPCRLAPGAASSIGDAAGNRRTPGRRRLRRWLASAGIVVSPAGSARGSSRVSLALLRLQRQPVSGLPPVASAALAAR